MSALKCGCVIATPKNTESVRKGFEMGGYVKSFCYRHGSKKKPPPAASLLPGDLHDLPGLEEGSIT